MSKLINIGFGNFTNPDKIVSVIRPDSAPAKRLVQAAKDNGTAIDATQGKTKGVIVAENGSVILSALLPDTIAGRCAGDMGGKI